MLLKEGNIGPIQLKNRVIMPPMCMYQAIDGYVQDFHLVHYGSRAIGGVGLVIVEATGVLPEGRITDQCLGLWEDGQMQVMKKLVDVIHQNGAKAFIQLNHAGRKSQVKNLEYYAPSAINYDDTYQMPKELTLHEILHIEDAFVTASKRAMEAGFDGIEIHAAHGYLIDEFLSPLTNKRTDAYGQNRGLFLQEITAKIRQAIGFNKALTVRVSAEDYDPNGIHPQDIIDLVKPVEGLLNAIHVSSGGLLPIVPPNIKPGYQVDYARYIKENLQLPVIAVGILEDYDVAENVLESNAADFVAIGRGLLYDPYWLLHYAFTKNIAYAFPTSYERGFHHHH